jgi:hypothetical protein
MGKKVVVQNLDSNGEIVQFTDETLTNIFHV